MKTIERLYNQLQKDKKAYEEYYNQYVKDTDTLIALANKLTKSYNDYEKAVWERL